MSIKKTKQAYDFIAILENKINAEINIIFKNSENILNINPLNWLGILADKSGYAILDDIKNNNFEIQVKKEN